MSSVRARLKRLERKTGVGQMCLGCKRNLILYADTIRRTRREDLDVRPCKTCGFPSFTILDGYSGRERELLHELFFGGDSPARTLAERQRRYAAELYWYILPRTREIKAAGDSEERRLRSVEPPPSAVRAQLKVLDEWKALEADREASRKLRRSGEDDAERESRRAKSAPTMAVIERAREGHTTKGRLKPGSDEELYYLEIMTGLEALIYGAALHETLAKIEARERHIREEAERREREERERQERLERERFEREERYRLEREQRERERLEREWGREARPPAEEGETYQSGHDAPVARDWRADRRVQPLDPEAVTIPEFPAAPLGPDELLRRALYSTESGSYVWRVRRKQFERALAADRVDEMFRIAGVGEDERRRRGYSKTYRERVRTQYPVAGD